MNLAKRLDDLARKKAELEAEEEFEDDFQQFDWLPSVRKRMRYLHQGVMVAVLQLCQDKLNRKRKRRKRTMKKWKRMEWLMKWKKVKMINRFQVIKVHVQLSAAANVSVYNLRITDSTMTCE